MLGTYPMSSEGLDVKELNTVIFASPKSDTVQSIGRILRMITETIPTAYDNIDESMSVFKRQSLHRKRFYKKNGYSTIYHNVMDDNNSIKDTIHQYNENKQSSILNYKQQEKKIQKNLEDICYV